MVKRISTTMTVNGETTRHSLVVDNDDIIGGVRYYHCWDPYTIADFGWISETDIFSSSTFTNGNATCKMTAFFVCN